MLGNYKIRVNNEAESKEAQELFEKLGYENNINMIEGIYAIYTCQYGSMTWTNHLEHEWFLDNEKKELTLPQLRDMVSAHRKPTEQGLISGADAKLAWAKGEELEFRNQKDKWYKNWTNVYDAKNGFSIQEFDDTNYEFRLKPRTITLNVEIPAPFEPKVGEEVFYINDTNKSGYCVDEHQAHYNYNFGAWRTEEEIKQVVAALRGALK